eukprot:342069-Pelagomonas_calceolata.AAC.1
MWRAPSHITMYCRLDVLLARGVGEEGDAAALPAMLPMTLAGALLPSSFCSHTLRAICVQACNETRVAECLELLVGSSKPCLSEKHE